MTHLAPAKVDISLSALIVAQEANEFLNDVESYTHMAAHPVDGHWCREDPRAARAAMAAVRDYPHVSAAIVTSGLSLDVAVRPWVFDEFVEDPIQPGVTLLQQCCDYRSCPDLLAFILEHVKGDKEMYTVCTIEPATRTPTPTLRRRC